MNAARQNLWKKIAPYFSPPPEHTNDFGPYRSVLKFDDGRLVERADQWPARRQEILDYWHRMLTPWPALIDKPKFEIVESTRRENFTQHKIRIQVDNERINDGYLLVPDGAGPFPAAVVVFYQPESSVGLDEKNIDRADYGINLTRRGFVTLSIGTPGGEARGLGKLKTPCQPLSYLGYVGANCYNALANLDYVDPKRIGIVGHSYGGKWAMFAACLYEKFALGAWSDPGIAFDESRPNVNYWEPWYLGREAHFTRERGVVTPENPRTGPYKELIETGHDLHEIQALMAPRPFLVSGGAEDPPARWNVLNHVVAVNKVLGYENRVAMTNRPDHSPNPVENEKLYSFFEYFLK